jgi:hypothetical protein
MALNVVPLKAKKPLVQWRVWADKRQSETEFKMLPWDVADGIALIGGSKTLGGLYFVAIDYDVKNLSEDAMVVGRWLTDLLPKTRVEKTPSGGEHWLYLCRDPCEYVKKYHDCCAIEILGSSWLTIMYPSVGYSILDNTPIAMIDNFDSLVEEMKKHAPVKNTNYCQNYSGLQLVSGYPSCVLNAVEELAKTGELDHEERLFLCTYLVNTIGAKETMEIIKVANDFKYGMTWYQLNWLARNKYRPCKCDKLIDLGLCHAKCNLYPYPLHVGE